jgi:maltooligosyltrehalose synthase
MDVLENGRSSLFSHYLDIDWDSPHFNLRNRLLVPVLGDHLGTVLEGTVLFQPLTIPSTRAVHTFLRKTPRC